MTHINILDIKRKWKSQFLDDDLRLESHSGYKIYLDYLSNKSLVLWKSMKPNNINNLIWEKDENETISSEITKYFNNLELLTISYLTEGTNLYMNMEVYSEIVLSLDVIIEKMNYNGNFREGNWWDYEIGSAHSFLNILILLENYLPSKKILNYISIISKYVGSPYTLNQNIPATGPNLIDLTLGYLGIAVLQNDFDKIQIVKEAIESTLCFSVEGEGMYEDGGYVLHKFIPSNGNYGVNFVKNCSRLIYLLEETVWEIGKSKKEILIKYIKVGCLPFLIFGRIPSSLNGRSMSRPIYKTDYSNEKLTALSMIESILQSLFLFSKEEKKQIRVFLSKHLSKITQEYSMYLAHKPVQTLKKMLFILQEEEINERTISSYTKIIDSINQVVQYNETYAIIISTYSNMIGNYESINQENLHGWHANDGMVALYLSNNKKHFGESYWPTVDSYRLPGTTIDLKPLKDSEGTRRLSPEEWIGGVTLDTFSVLSMKLNKEKQGIEMNLFAKKSWFLLAGKLICLGSEITAKTDYTIETIIDNRIIDFDTTLFFNGNPIKKSNKFKVSNNDIIEIDGEEQNISYMFFQDSNLEITIEQREGSYKNINKLFVDDKKYIETYATFSILHGNNCNDDCYAYAMFPNVKTNELLNSQKKSVQILCNTKNTQAIFDEENSILAVIFWDDAGGILENMSVNFPCSLIVKKKNDEIQLVIKRHKIVVNSIFIFDGKIEAYEIDEEKMKYNAQNNHFIFDDSTKEYEIRLNFQ